MDYFAYKDGALWCEDVPVSRMAEEMGTPLWVYSQRTILHHFEQIKRAFAEVDPLVCYSVKANGNLSICRLLAEAGAGFDVVSGGELYRVLEAGGDGSRVVFAGVGKSDTEIDAALDAGVALFDVESGQELETVSRLAEARGRFAPVALRVNPDVDAHTHEKITTGLHENKFGLDEANARRAMARATALPGVDLVGVHMHIGSQITSVEPYALAMEKAVAMVRAARDMGHDVRWLNIGGGFGIHYRDSEARSAVDFARVIVPFVVESGCRLILEPGRFIVGNAGVLVSRVLYTKLSTSKRFVIQDAAMTDLIRPTLYGAFHRIWPVCPGDRFLPAPKEGMAIPGTVVSDVVGPVCESGDFLAKDRPLPPVERGDLLAVFSAGAYGMVMSSNYNSRPRAAEVLVDGDRYRCVRRRETYADLVQAELGPTDGD